MRTKNATPSSYTGNGGFGSEQGELSLNYCQSGASKSSGSVVMP